VTRAPAAGIAAERDPSATLRALAMGYIAPRCLYAVAELGLADALHDEPASASDLARSVGADPDALRRVLRLLAAYGVFEIDGEQVRHTPLSRLLRDDHPQSMRSYARMVGMPINWTAYGAFLSTMRTGRPEGEPDHRWTYYAKHPDEAAIFNSAMIAKARSQVGAVTAAYDFSRFATIADIGGGHGQLVRAIVASVPRARGIVFDLPHVIEEARSAASDERVMFHPGSFFDDALPSCDLYLLMEVIHDWPDAEAVAILQSVRRAAAPGATLLVIESIVPETPGPDPAKTIDVHMMALFGGRQRTRAEYERLLGAAGFAVKGQIDTDRGISIVESVAH